MQDSQTPIKVPLAFAANAGANYIGPIPIASQIGITAGAASFEDGFPPLTFVPLATGGAGPFGKDFNGLLHQLSAGVQWAQAGGPYFYDAVFSGQIGGYPKGALLAADPPAVGLWYISLVDNNGTNPNLSGAGWLLLAMRRPLVAGTNYYVAPGGDDGTGDGSAALPWKTPSHAAAVLGAIDLRQQTVTVNLAAGTYPPLHVSGGFLGQADIGSVVFLGDPVTPTNVNIAAVADSAITAEAGANFSVHGVHVVATGVGASQGYGMVAGRGSNISFQNCDFGACAFTHISANEGSSVTALGSYTISGSAPTHLFSDALGTIQTVPGITVTLNGGPAFSTGYALATRNSLIIANGCTFAGAATGKRYTANLGGGIDTSGGGATYFPGDAGGTATSPGWYN